MSREEIIIDPSWSFQEAVSKASDRFRPGGLVSGKARNVLIQSWAQIVGKRKALHEVTAYIEEAGSFSAAAKSLSMSIETLKALLDYINRLPNEGADIQPISTKLKKGQKKLYELLKGANAGDIVTRKEVRDLLGWTDSTVNTYLSKNMLSEFFEPISKNTFKVLTNSKDISESLIAASLSQIRNEHLNISTGEILNAQLSKYMMKARLGNGAVGAVYKAQDKNSGTFHAIKILSPRRDLLKPIVFENVKRRFSREARNGMKLKSDYIIRYQDYGNYKGLPFIVMELADSNLGHELKTLGKLTANDSLSVIQSCLKGLIYLHKSRHVHRDIKPDNILRLNNKYMLADLGIVKWSDFSDAFISAGTITQNDMQLGSWYYMSPEQGESPSSATQAADIYALGVTWYQLLTLNLMHPARIASRMYNNPCDVEDINQCIRKMLDYDHNNRPKAKELLESVEKILDGVQKAA